ncbi:MAG: hypothetical protein KGL18_17870 [Burkholderiales bacterium]|nr:hypothetical protein [Burkholderiales bacterium]MDE1929334.1 hypothetical protein [Burkholderiales bacterium]MDE2159105.1 hypothetical protein [Burkholderiales bacterium]MDE2504835.1 hypothetical protein [Burkholderiales bacterium]
MNHAHAALLALSLSALCALAPTSARADPVPKVVADYTVFLDPPTGYVFVKLPAGWKFVGQVGTRDMARLPAGVVTSLLVDAPDTGASGRLAAVRGSAAARTESRLP